MADKNKQDNKNAGGPLGQPPRGREPDAAGRSLSEALRISFIILKVIMIVLIVAFLASGFKMVDAGEKALVLQFGQVQGSGDKRVLGPGLHWILPYPVQEMVKIPTEEQVTLPVNSFWYFQTQDEIVSKTPRRVELDQPLNPSRDGYCLTRGETMKGDHIGASGDDYNIVHCKWLLTYQIGDVERFFRNVYVKDVRPGEDYGKSIRESVAPLLQYLVEDAVVTAMVNYTIDEALESREKIQRHVKKLLEEKLEDIESGIKVVSVYPVEMTYPRQVSVAFQAAIGASQQSEIEITNAKTEADDILNRTAGPVATELFNALHDPTVTPEQMELLWAQVAGAAREKIAEARAHREQVVQRASARADYLEQLLPEYRKYPKLVIQKIYQDTMEYVFKNAAEKIVLAPAKDGQGREVRVLTNRDPMVKSKAEREKRAKQKQEQQSN
jgi:membrane protease subunit HflK